MIALTIVGYAMLAIGIILTIYVIVKKLESGNSSSNVRLFDKVEISLPVPIVVIVLGAILAVVGTFGPAIDRAIGGSEPSPSASPASTPSAAAPPLDTPPSNEDSPATIELREPVDGDIVTPDGFAVSGASNLGPDDILWTVYQGIADNSPSFQPSAEPCTIENGGIFTCPRQYVGGSGDSGVRFRVFFLLSTPEASQVFIDYANSDPESQGYPGLENLPSGVQEVEAVAVQRE